MSPFLHNSVIAILALIYVFAVVGLMDFAVKKGFPQDLSRKVVHIAAGSWLIFWPFFDASHWSKYFNIIPALLWTILLLIKGFTAKPDDKAVKTMTRTGDRRELLKGPLFFTIVMNIMGTVFFNTSLALTAMGMLGWGDGLAPVIGSRYGKHDYNYVTRKTIEGSATFFIAGLFGVIIFHLILGISFPLHLIVFSLFATTFMEALSPKEIDNLLIPFTVFVIYLLGGQI